MKSLIGTGVALITPFLANGEVDVEGEMRENDELSSESNT